LWLISGFFARISSIISCVVILRRHDKDVLALLIFFAYFGRCCYVY
jgi:hypothetical protein